MISEINRELKKISDNHAFKPLITKMVEEIEEQNKRIENLENE